MEDSFNFYYGLAQDALVRGFWNTAVLNFIHARTATNVQSEMGLAFTGQASAFAYLGNFALARPAAILGYNCQNLEIQQGQGETPENLNNRFRSASVAGRVCVADALIAENAKNFKPGSNAGAFAEAWGYFEVALNDESKLTQEYTHMISRSDPDVIELAARNALATSFDDNRNRAEIAKRARQARSAVRKTHGLRSPLFRTTLVAAVANRLVTPGPSLRRRTAVRLANLKGVL